MDQVNLFFKNKSDHPFLNKVMIGIQWGHELNDLIVSLECSPLEKEKNKLQIFIVLSKKII